MDGFMKRKLYPNIKRMTSLFCVAILCVTVTSVVLRLTVFSEVAATTSTKEEELYTPEETLFPYTISRKVQFDTPQSKGSFRIENPETNEFYMTVSIILPQTDENLFYTGFIRPGEGREAAALHIPLPNGVYDCVAEITTFDPDTLEPRGADRQDITLYIGEKIK